MSDGLNWAVERSITRSSKHMLQFFCCKVYAGPKNLKENEKERNLQNRRGHAHNNRFPCISHQPLLNCINFWADSIFWPHWTMSPWSEREIWPYLKGSNISETEKVTPIKIGLHAFHINLYLIASIYFLSWFYFLTPLDYSPWSEREIWPYLKGSNISKTRKVAPIKIGLHAFHVNLYLHESFEPILFFDSHDG